MTAPARPTTIVGRLAAALVAILVLPLALAGCSLFAKDRLTVLAGSEVKDMAPILEEMAREIGVELEFEYMGTLDGTEALLANAADPAWDAAWFPSNRYLSLFPEAEGLVAKSESIMRSRISLGLKPEVAERLGWTAQAPTWQQLVDAIGKGEVSYGMTSPIASNSGFTTLVQLATAISGTGTVLEEADIQAATPQLIEFAKGQQLASGSSGWLAERFAAEPGQVDGIFNYESVLDGLAVDGRPLTVVNPSDGSITSDYPLSLLRGADQATTDRFDKVLEYLLRDEVQQRIADTTLRMTSAGGGGAGAQPYPVYELPFPNQLATVQTLLSTWLTSVKKPSNMVFQIDTSGSMSNGSRMEDLQAALRVLSGEGASGSGSLLQLQPREQIAFLEFAGSVKSEWQATIPERADPSYQSVMSEVSSHIDGLRPNGDTAIYSTLEQSYERAAAGAGEGSISSIVLFTDGQNTSGKDAGDFERWYPTFVAQHPEAKDIPVFAIVFGEADAEELTKVAELTGGRSFSAESDSLAAVFREIRGYL